MADTRRELQAEIERLEDLAARLGARLEGATLSADERWLCERDVRTTHERLELARQQQRALEADHGH
jgi:hypothetical protein